MFETEFQFFSIYMSSFHSPTIVYLRARFFNLTYTYVYVEKAAGYPLSKTGEFKNSSRTTHKPQAARIP